MQDAIKADFTITLSRNGKTEITGPLADKALCYKMLLEALFLVREWKNPNPLAEIVKP